MKKYFIAAFAAVAVAMIVSCTVPGPAGPAGADTFTIEFQEGVFPGGGYQGVSDAEVNTDYINYSSGGDTMMWVGYDGDTWRSLVRFDVSEMTPLNVSIKSAYLTLYVAYTGTAEGVTITARPLTRAWEEGDELFGDTPDTNVSWLYYDGAGFSWTSAGGDFGTSAACTPVYVSQSGKFVTLKLDAVMVQSWIDNPAANYGIILMDSTEAGATHYIDIRTSETADPGLRPKLTLNYSVNQ